MKLVIAVVQDKDSGLLINNLVDQGYRATKLASTGGFLTSGNTTLLIGVEDDQVPNVLSIIKDTCKTRNAIVSSYSPGGGTIDSYVPYPVEVTVGGATIFVLNVEHFERV